MGHWSESEDLLEEARQLIARGPGRPQPTLDELAPLLRKAAQEIELLAGRTFSPPRTATRIFESDGLPFIEVPDLLLGSEGELPPDVHPIPDPVRPTMAFSLQTGRWPPRSGGIWLAPWATPPRSVDAPFVELHERQSTAVLAMSNGAPPADYAADRAELHATGSLFSGSTGPDARDAGDARLQPVDIATSVSEVDAAVYSPAVLHLRGQSREQSRDIMPTDAARYQPPSFDRRTSVPTQFVGGWDAVRDVPWID